MKRGPRVEAYVRSTGDDGDELVYVGSTSTGGIITARSSNELTWRLWTSAGTSTSVTCGCEWGHDGSATWPMTWTSTSTNHYAHTDMWTDWIECEARAAEVRASYRAVTAEQRAAWRRREQELLAASTKAEAERVAARERARALLVSCLSPAQREDLAKRKCFYVDVRGDDGVARRFRIDEHTHGNVKLLDDKGSIVGQYCVQPDNVPVEDAMLAQKLWLDANPAEFVRKANFSPHRMLTDADRRLIIVPGRAA